MSAHHLQARVVRQAGGLSHEPGRSTCRLCEQSTVTASAVAGWLASDPALPSSLLGLHTSHARAGRRSIQKRVPAGTTRASLGSLWSLLLRRSKLGCLEGWISCRLALQTRTNLLTRVSGLLRTQESRLLLLESCWLGLKSRLLLLESSLLGLETSLPRLEACLLRLETRWLSLKATAVRLLLLLPAHRASSCNPGAPSMTFYKTLI